MSSKPTLLFATDFGKCATAAIPRARMLAELFDAEVLLVYVQPSFWKHWTSSGSVEREAETRLADWARRLESQGVRARTLVGRGSPAEAIVGLADHEEARLVVIGAGDKSLVDRYWTGATAETVARYTPRPVWISRPQHDGPIRKVLCGVDGSVTSGHAAVEASRLCAKLGASLTLMTTLDFSDLNPLGMRAAEVTRAREGFESEAIRELDAFIDSLSLETTGLKPERRHLWGRPADVLRAAAADDGFDLVVLGRTGRSHIHRVLVGSTAERLLRNSPCSLLLCEQLPEREMT